MSRVGVDFVNSLPAFKIQDFVPKVETIIRKQIHLQFNGGMFAAVHAVQVLLQFDVIKSLLSFGL